MARHWLVMGLKIDNSLVDVRLSKMEAAIENIAFLAINQLMAHKVTTFITAKAMFTEEPKWTTVMAKNVRQMISQVVSWALETLVDAPK